MIDAMGLSTVSYNFLYRKSKGLRIRNLAKAAFLRLRDRG